MRIGILPNLYPAGGGVYQYSQNVLRALNGCGENGSDDEFVLLTDDPGDPRLISLKQDGWEIRRFVTIPLRQHVFCGIRRMLGEGPHREALRWLRKQLITFRSNPIRRLPDPDVIRHRPALRRRIRRCKLDLVLYPHPRPVSFESGVPYLMAVHDLQHRLQPEFPEVSADGEWEYREYLFRNGCRYATLILADSDVGKEDVLNFYGAYGITADRVKVLPYLPATYLTVDVLDTDRERVRTIYDLPDQYFFYPAQFWPHKNHARLVQALRLLKTEYHIDAPIVFCGSHDGQILERTYNEVMSLRSSLGIGRDVRYLGYIPEEDMSALYSGAVALVMPTFFGPTNIPVLEAWSVGCPVLTSDIRGVREQVADAAVLVDPRSVESMAEGMCRLWTDENLRRELMDAGRRRLSSYTPDDFRNRLIEILEEAKDRVRSKGSIVAVKNIDLHDIEKLVCDHPAVHDGRAVAFGLHNPELGTDDIIVAAETETDEDLKAAVEIERAVRNTIVAKLSVTPRAIYLKPPKWIAENVAGKPARSTTREKILIEQPELVGKEHEYLFEVVNDSVMSRTIEGRINFWNRRAEELYGWSKEEAIGKVSHKLLQTRFPRALEEIHSELVRNGRWKGKLVHATRDGRRVAVESRWILHSREQPGRVVEINTRTSNC
jgi:PAS domain S-box-containing protein